MNSDEDRQLFTFVTGLMLGAVIGAGVAFLTAPQSGRRTRKKLVRAASDLKDTASGRWDDLAEDVKGRVDQAIQGARERFGS